MKVKTMIDPTERFTSRVDNYVKYRPGYPQRIIETLREDCGLTQDSIVADMGSGTGILTELFLQNGNTIYAVEPNRAMRTAAEDLLHNRAGFHSVAARAEATTLSSASIDFVVAGRAFHWFDHEKARHEFLRILKPSGWVILIWNKRDSRLAPFLTAYEHVRELYSIDQLKHKSIDLHKIARLYGGDKFQSKTYRHQQNRDYKSLVGFTLSHSHTPEPGHPNYEPMLKALAEIFETHQVNGQVSFDYATITYYGRLAS